MPDNPPAVPIRSSQNVFDGLTFEVLHFGGIIHRPPPAVTEWPKSDQPAEKGFLIDEQL